MIQLDVKLPFYISLRLDVVCRLTQSRNPLGASVNVHKNLKTTTTAVQKLQGQMTRSKLKKTIRKLDTALLFTAVTQFFMDTKVPEK